MAPFRFLDAFDAEQEVADNATEVGLTPEELYRHQNGKRMRRAKELFRNPLRMIFGCSTGIVMAAHFKSQTC